MQCSEFRSKNLFEDYRKWPKSPVTYAKGKVSRRRWSSREALGDPGSGDRNDIIVNQRKLVGFSSKASRDCGTCGHLFAIKFQVKSSLQCGLKIRELTELQSIRSSEKRETDPNRYSPNGGVRQPSSEKLFLKN